MFSGHHLVVENQFELLALETDFGAKRFFVFASRIRQLTRRCTSVEMPPRFPYRPGSFSDQEFLLLAERPP
jgi:hypothetical protein